MELNWLPLSDRKSVPTPRVVFIDTHEVSGFYSARGICYDGHVPTLGERDIIAISSHWGDAQVASVLAHEFRHMQQHYLPNLPRLRPAPWLDWSADWAKQIRRFYSSRPWEMDALRYKLRIAPSESNDQVREVVHDLL